MTALVENVLPQGIYSPWNASFYSSNPSYPSYSFTSSPSTFVRPTPIPLSNATPNGINLTRSWTPPPPSSSSSTSSIMTVEKKKAKKVNFKQDLVVVYPVQKYPHIFYTHDQEIHQFQTWVPDTPPPQCFSQNHSFRTCPSAKHSPLTSILRKPRHSIIHIFDDSLPFDIHAFQTTPNHSPLTNFTTSIRTHLSSSILQTTTNLLSFPWNVSSVLPSFPLKIKNTLRYLSYQLGSWCATSYNEKSRL